MKDLGRNRIIHLQKPQGEQTTQDQLRAETDLYFPKEHNWRAGKYNVVDGGHDWITMTSKRAMAHFTVTEDLPA